MFGGGRAAQEQVQRCGKSIRIIALIAKVGCLLAINGVAPIVSRPVSEKPPRRVLVCGHDR
jgi:hypothetical protein